MLLHLKRALVDYKSFVTRCNNFFWAVLREPSIERNATMSILKAYVSCTDSESFNTTTLGLADSSGGSTEETGLGPRESG